MVKKTLFLLLRTGKRSPQGTSFHVLLSLSVFTSSKPDTSRPNWLRVGLAFGASAFLWALLFKQHSSDVREYKARNGLE
uniref:NADH dehydrogenase [ubiquinone] 1 subunit C1, mitochondrial n=1 Tax=Salarias fasciatus TaxID=181472 RepID=A0A672FAG5_SALFA